MYVFNLRGNQRTAGEQSRKEGGKVFGSGSRAAVSILIGVKDPNNSGFDLHYRDIGDYLSASEKLAIVNTSTIENVDWQSIVPNQHGDWLNQRSDDFATWPAIGEKKGTSAKFFAVHSAGLQTNRDAWVYSYSENKLNAQVKEISKNYNEVVEAFSSVSSDYAGRGETQVAEFLKENPQYSDPSFIKWSRSLRHAASKGATMEVSQRQIVPSLYRPFSSQFVYFDEILNHEPVSYTHLTLPTKRIV